jgi:hypothetical protein
LSDIPSTFGEILFAVQADDLRIEEERVIAERRAREALQAQRDSKQVNMRQLMKQLYGDQVEPPLQAPKGTTDVAPKQQQPVTAFPPPPSRR